MGLKSEEYGGKKRSLAQSPDPRRPEHGAVHGTVNDKERSHSTHPQLASECFRLPMTMWFTRTVALATLGVAAKAGHFLVESSVSSINTSFCGSRSNWQLNQCFRFFRISGRSCSSASTVFFEREAAADDDIHLVTQSDHCLVERDVFLHLNHRHDGRHVRVKARAARLSLMLCRALADFAGAPDPDNRCCHTNSETCGNRAG